MVFCQPPLVFSPWVRGVFFAFNRPQWVFPLWFFFFKFLQTFDIVSSLSAISTIVTGLCANTWAGMGISEIVHRQNSVQVSVLNSHLFRCSEQSPVEWFWASERQTDVTKSPPTRCKCIRKDIQGITRIFVQKHVLNFTIYLRPGKEDQVPVHQGQQNGPSLYDSEVKLD